MSKNLYETFHNKAKSQQKIINSNNFTYKVILSILDPYLTTNKDILDIGCGVGTLSLYCAKKSKKVLGIDISKNAISIANNSVKYLKLKNVNFETVDFPQNAPKGTYDLILCSEVLEHLPDDSLALKKIFNLLKPNGIAIISTPTKTAPMYRLGLASNFDKRVGHLRRYLLNELISKMY